MAPYHQEERTIILNDRELHVTFEFFKGDPHTGIEDEYHVLEICEDDRVIWSQGSGTFPNYLIPRVIAELEDVREFERKVY